MGARMEPALVRMVTVLIQYKSNSKRPRVFILFCVCGSQKCASVLIALMRCHTDGALDGVVDDFRQGRVGVHAKRELFECCSARHCVCALLHQIRRVHPNDMHAQNRLRVLAEQNLRNPIALSLRQCLRVCAEERRRLPQLEPVLLRLLLCRHFAQPHHRNLRVREASSWHRIVINHVLPAHDILHRRHALRGRRMRQHQLPIGVANAKQMRRHHFRAVFSALQHAHVLINRHKPAALQLHADRVQSKRGRLRRAPSRNHARIDLQLVHHLAALRVRELDSHRRLARLARRDLCSKHVGVKVDWARVDEQALRETRDFRVKSRHDIGHGFNKRHVCAERRVHV
mmetsp:Transcript_13571/g.29393  ORF Transcript_13571/g.29393 Transcript_13571/m.29393 type:complete len:343 (+) Transcript_13571:1854-2882(+)